MFVLAHLSDPHLAPLPAPHLGELVGKRVLGYLNWKRKRGAIHRAGTLDAIVQDVKSRQVDHIAVTGDLINIALPIEFERARAWLEDLGAPDEVTLVPGNHDAYVRAAAGGAIQRWAPYMRGDDLDSFPFLRRRGHVALIGLSSAAPTGPLLATGRLGDEQLGKLETLLAGLKREGLFRVVLIHHPPASKASRHFKRLTDGAALRAVLRKHGAELVIHGHDHVRRVLWLDGPAGGIPAIGVPSASATPAGADEPATYHLFEIGGRAGAWICTLVARGFAKGGDEIAERARISLSA